MKGKLCRDFSSNPPLSDRGCSGPWGWIRATSVPLPHYTDTDSPSLLPAISLFILPSLFTLSVNIVLIILRRCRYAWKTSWEKSLSLSLSVTVSLCPSLTYSCVLTSEVLGGEALPCDSFVTLWQPVECHWENITSANVALCDTAFEVEESCHLCTVVCACKGDHCSLWGSVARVIITPCQSRPILMLFALLHVFKSGSDMKRKAVTVAQSILNCLFYVGYESLSK